MRLEHYINRQKNPQPKKEPEVVFYALDIDSFDTISNGKKQLVKEVVSHLDSEQFKDVHYRYEHGTSEYGFYQSESADGLRGLVRIKLGNTRGSYDERLEKYPRDKFNKEYGRCVKAGSQRYTSIQLLRYHDVEEGTHYYTQIFFTDDGKAFVDRGGAEFIAGLSEGQLGNALARKCVEIEQQREKNRQYRLNHPRY